jgi:hypothetical protein
MTYFQVGSGDVVGSVHMNTAINQGIPVFGSFAERDAAIPSPTIGMHCFVNDLTTSTGGLTERYRSTGWEVISGDTGWRDLTGELLNGWLSTGAQYPAMVRRVDRTVHLEGMIQNPANRPANDNIVVTHLGRPAKGIYYLGNSSGTPFRLTIDSGGSLNADAAYTVTSWTNIHISWATYESWPSTLPGVPLV